MNKHLRLLIIFFLSATLNSGAQTWIPTNSPPVNFRFTDTYFLNNDTGFAIHYPGVIKGYIMKTNDGGINWTKVLDSSIFKFRDIVFTDALHGWVGTFENNNAGADTNVIYQTVDGGISWNGVPGFPGPQAAGICGLFKVNDSTVYGTGRYSGPAGFYKTTNNGLTWSYTNIDSLVTGLVDLYFFDPDTGFVIGTTGPLYNNGHARILYTTNGGTTWSTAYTSTHISTIGWKIVFPSRNTGYCSMQAFNLPSSEYFLKTIDGGITWSEIVYSGGPSNGYNVEGIGFLNDTIGWVGGDANSYFTQNGGINWTLQMGVNNLNRFRFLSDTVGFAAGQKIYKLQIIPTGIASSDPPVYFQSVYPNPANEWANFEFFVYNPGKAKLAIYDLKGVEVEVLFDKFFDQGNQFFVWQPTNLKPGIYVCKLHIDDEVIARKLEILK